MACRLATLCSVRPDLAQIAHPLLRQLQGETDLDPHTATRAERVLAFAAPLEHFARGNDDHKTQRFMGSFNPFGNGQGAEGDAAPSQATVLGRLMTGLADHVRPDPFLSSILVGLRMRVAAWDANCQFLLEYVIAQRHSLRTVENVMTAEEVVSVIAGVNGPPTVSVQTGTGELVFETDSGTLRWSDLWAVSLCDNDHPATPELRQLLLTAPIVREACRDWHLAGAGGCGLCGCGRVLGQ